MEFALANVNYAVSRYDYDDPAFAGFVDNLDRINALAESCPGFIWRHVSDDDDAEARRVFADDRLIFNMSLWSSVDALREFVYRSDHADLLRQRRDWFLPQQGPTLALWWQPAGVTPTVTEAKHRIDCLRLCGPTADAFTFHRLFDAPGDEAVC